MNDLSIYNNVRDIVRGPDPSRQALYDVIGWWFDEPAVRNNAREARTIEEELVAAYDLAMCSLCLASMLWVGASQALQTGPRRSLFQWCKHRLLTVRLPPLKYEERNSVLARLLMRQEELDRLTPVALMLTYLESALSLRRAYRLGEEILARIGQRFEERKIGITTTSCSATLGVASSVCEGIFESSGFDPLFPALDGMPDVRELLLPANLPKIYESYLYSCVCVMDALGSDFESSLDEWLLHRLPDEVKAAWAKLAARTNSVASTQGQVPHPDGPGTDGLVFFQGDCIRLQPCPAKVFGLIWNCERVAIQAILDSVWEDNWDAGTKPNFKTALSRVNTRLRKIKWPWKYRIDPGSRTDIIREPCPSRALQE